jgi:hypothetical protein
VPNAFGAICLNNAGLASFNKYNPLPEYFEIFTSSLHVRILQDGDVAVSAGTAMDELMRHQPSLKEKIMTEIMNLLDKVYKMGTEDAPEWLYRRKNIALQGPPDPNAPKAESDEDEEDKTKQSNLDNYVTDYIEISARVS